MDLNPFHAAESLVHTAAQAAETVTHPVTDVMTTAIKTAGGVIDTAIQVHGASADVQAQQSTEALKTVLEHPQAAGELGAAAASLA